MRFTQQAKAIAGFGILVLVSSFTMVGVTKASELSVKPKMGGIPAICHLERINKTSDLKQQFQAFDRLFDRYQRAKQDSLVLQLVKGMDKKQFPQLQAEELLQVAYRYRTAAESEKAIPLLSQVFQLLQSVNDDESSYDTHQYIWQTTRYHQGKAPLVESLAGNLIALKQQEQAEVALLQALQTRQKQSHSSPETRVRYIVEIANGFLAIDKPEQAIALLDQALQITQSLNHTKESRDSKEWLILLSTLSWEYRLAGENRKADLLFNQSLEYANTFSKPDSKVFVLSIIAEAAYSNLSQYELDKFPIAQRTALIDARRAKWEKVFGKILEIVRSGYTAKMYPNTSLIAAEWYQFLGIESAMQIVNTVADPAKRFEVISPMLKSQNRDFAKEDTERLVPLLNQADAIVRTIQKPNERDRGWGVMAATYAQLGQSQKALEAIGQIQSAELKQETLIDVAIHLARAGQPDLALSLVKDFPDTTILVQQVLYDSQSAYLKNGQLEAAIGLQRRLSKEFKDYGLTSLAQTSAKVGRTQQALMLLKQVSKTRWRLDAIISIIQQALDVGDRDRAVVFAQQISEDKDRDRDQPSKSWVMEEIAIAYAEAGEYDKSIQLSQSLPDRSLSQLATCAKRSH
jgi:hypothetical protein